jgi:hypothetical protein
MALALGALALLHTHQAGISTSQQRLVIRASAMAVPPSFARHGHMAGCAGRDAPADESLFEKVPAADERAAAARLGSAARIRATYAAPVCGH